MCHSFSSVSHDWPDSGGLSFLFVWAIPCIQLLNNGAPTAVNDVINS